MKEVKCNLRNPEICTIKSQLFYSPSYKPDDYIESVDSVKVDFKSGEVKNIIGQWINQHSDLTKITKLFSPDSTHALFNLVVVKGKWSSLSDKSSPIMKIYNSFNYTQDVKYEARLLEFPLHDNDFKLVMVVPNETDTLKNLVNTLNNRGLEEAVKIIQPLFTATSQLVAPKIKIESEIQNKFSNRMAVQCGDLNVNENGIDATILTCLYNSNQDDDYFSLLNSELEDTASFFFAITFKGIAIITGKYNTT